METMRMPTVYQKTPRLDSPHKRSHDPRLLARQNDVWYPLWLALRRWTIGQSTLRLVRSSGTSPSTSPRLVSFGVLENYENEQFARKRS